jgi:hypothetical protein
MVQAGIVDPRAVTVRKAGGARVSRGASRSWLRTGRVVTMSRAPQEHGARASRHAPLSRSRGEAHGCHER